MRVWSLTVWRFNERLIAGESIHIEAGRSELEDGIVRRILGLSWKLILVDLLIRMV